MTNPGAKVYRLFAVETHPIQYKAPLFRRLAAQPRLDLTVLYAMIPDAAQQGAGFGVSFAWDVPLRDGYPSEVLENRAAHPAATTFSGCDTPGLCDRLKRGRPDAVLVNGWGTKTALQALWACRRLGIPCLVRGEANLLRPRAAWKHVLHRLLLRQYDAYLAIGSANREFYRFHRCPQNRIFSAPYAVDNDFFAAQAAARAGRRDELRARFGLPRAACVFLFAGKLEDKKHPEDLIEALALLPPDLRSRAQALVAGNGPLREECEHRARAGGLPVSFAGFLNQSRLPDAYAAADVLVLPSDAGETWGLVVNEAMASGRPAVVSRAAGCCADLVEEDRTGHAFVPRDVRGLSEILAGYLRDPGLAARQGAAAAVRIRSFGCEQAAEGIVSAVAACAGGGGAAPC
jgi:glycosyltransferase involved in cell wall biosynthesis